MSLAGSSWIIQTPGKMQTTETPHKNLTNIGRSAQIICRGLGEPDEEQVRQNSTDGGSQGNQEMKSMPEEDAAGRTLKTSTKKSTKKK